MEWNGRRRFQGIGAEHEVAPFAPPADRLWE